MSTKIGELRETLIEAIEQVKSGKMDQHDANAIAKLAGAINANLSVELQAMKLYEELNKKVENIGKLALGEDR